MKILLTAPHSFCYDRNPDERHCDIMALSFVKNLSSKLEESGMEVYTHVSNRPRSDIDMNRKESRKTSFRKGITADLQKFGPDDVLLDIHSAPHDTLNWRFDIYILRIPESQETKNFALDLSYHLESDGMAAYVLNASKINDIIYEAFFTRSMCKVALLEINESTSCISLERISDAVFRFISGIRAR